MTEVVDGEVVAKGWHELGQQGPVGGGVDTAQQGATTASLDLCYNAHAHWFIDAIFDPRHWSRRAW